MTLQTMTPHATLDFATVMKALAAHAGLPAEDGPAASEPELVWVRGEMLAQLLPNPWDGQRALLSVTVRSLEGEWSSRTPAESARLLRWLFQVESDLAALHPWTLGIDDEDQLVLGVDLPLSECAPEALLPKVEEGLDLGDSLSALWSGLGHSQVSA